MERHIHRWLYFFYFLQELDPPAQVTGVSLSKFLRYGIPGLAVSWKVPESVVAISRYRIQYKRTGSYFWGSEAVTAGSPPATFAILVTLEVGTNYTVRVCATSVVGDGEWSKEETNRTLSRELYALFALLRYICLR